MFGDTDVFNVPCNWRNIVRWSGFKEDVIPQGFDFHDIAGRPRVDVHDSDVLLRVQRLSYSPTKIRDWLSMHDMEHVTFGRFSTVTHEWRTERSFMGVNFRLANDSDAALFKLRWRSCC